MIDQHHMLSMVDTLHEKYQFQDGECKEIVEALDGKKKPIDVENAQFVVIKFDRLMIVKWVNCLKSLPTITNNRCVKFAPTCRTTSIGITRHTIRYHNPH